MGIVQVPLASTVRWYGWLGLPTSVSGVADGWSLSSLSTLGTVHEYPWDGFDWQKRGDVFATVTVWAKIVVGRVKAREFGPEAGQRFFGFVGAFARSSA